MKYWLSTNESGSNVVVLLDGELKGANDTHPQWDELIEAVRADNAERVAYLVEPGAELTKGFARFSERVTYTDGHLYFDGDEVDNALTKHIVRFYNEGEDYAPLVNFFEKVAQNPNEHSREQLYRWLDKHDFPITEAGDIVAYKGVNSEDGKFVSVHSGTAVVDGVVHTGQIPYAIGSVVEMPRSEVQHDPSVGCHTGLHAGTWNYASSFGSAGTLTVSINPRDVVSVPTDCNDQKVRVCRLTVMDITESAHASAYYSEALDEEDAEPDEYCSDCYESEGYCVCDDKEAFDEALENGTPVDLYVPKHRPTNDNYKAQARDSRGHFIKKS